MPAHHLECLTAAKSRDQLFGAACASLTVSGDASRDLPAHLVCAARATPASKNRRPEALCWQSNLDVAVAGADAVRARALLQLGGGVGVLLQAKHPQAFPAFLLRLL